MNGAVAAAAAGARWPASRRLSRMSQLLGLHWCTLCHYTRVLPTHATHKSCRTPQPASLSAGCWLLLLTRVCWVWAHSQPFVRWKVVCVIRAVESICIQFTEETIFQATMWGQSTRVCNIAGLCCDMSWCAERGLAR